MMIEFQPKLEKSCSTGGLVKLITSFPHFGCKSDFASQECNLFLGQVEADQEITIKVSRLGDECAGILAKVILPALPMGVRWRTDVAELVIDHFELVIDGQPVYKCSGKVNAALCTALRKWPASLSPSLEKVARRSSQAWELVFPLLISSSWINQSFPIGQYSNIELKITVGKNLTVGFLDQPIMLAIESDYVFLSQELRNPAPPAKPKPTLVFALEQVCEPSEPVPLELEMLDFRGPVYDQLVGLIQAVPSAISLLNFALPETVLITASLPVAEQIVAHCDYKFQFWPQVSVIREKFTQTKRFKIQSPFACSALILCFTCNDQVQGQKLPFTTAKLYISNVDCHESDPIKASDWNWLKCGLAAPKPDQRFYLLPLSKEALDLEHQLPSTSHFGRSNVELEIQHSQGEWDLQIAVVNKNFLQSCDGRSAVRFTN